jgi:hypothetical protein
MAISHRNLSPYELFRATGEVQEPKYAFRPGLDHAQWKAKALPEVLATLGRTPAQTELNPELIVEFRDGGVLSQRWLIDVQVGISAIVVVNRPIDADGVLPAIFCWSGHSPHADLGKEPIMGNRSSKELDDYVRYNGMTYGRHMAEHGGYVTFAIDWMGQNDRNDSRKPNNRGSVNSGDVDWCNIYYLNATLLGYTPLGLNLIHGLRAVDFASGLDYVDANRIGVMGASAGGTLALWSTLLDDRLKATEIICYSDTFPDFALRDIQYCGSQITPGLFALVDVSDLQGLIAPRPLMVDVGAYDQIFRIESSLPCVERVEEIYAAAGASDVFRKQIFPGGHGWMPIDSVEFFQRHLGGL